MEPGISGVPRVSPDSFRNSLQSLKNVPKGRFELPRPCGHYALNVARLPFRHFGVIDTLTLAYTAIFVNCRDCFRLSQISHQWNKEKKGLFYERARSFNLASN